MTKYLIRVREIRVHEFEIDVDDEEAIEELAADLECGDSIRDSYDSQEFLDATIIE